MQSDSESSRLRDFIVNPRRGLWSLAIPMMLGMAVQTIYMIVDMIFVGRVGSGALTALAFNMPLLFFGLGLTFGLGSGVTAVIARFIGSGDKRNSDNSAEHAVVLGVVIGFALSLVGLKWGKPLLSTLGVPSHLLPQAWAYFHIIATGYVFVVTSVFFRSILSGEGDMKTPMIIQGAGTILNIILDPIFIFGLNMGIKGAAVATIASQAVVAAIFVLLLFVKKHAYVTFAMRDFTFSKDILGKIFKIGLPASFSMVIMSLGGGAFNKILVSFSGAAVAAYQVGGRINHLFLMPSISISTSLVTLVGMLYGAKRVDLLRRIIYYGMSRAIYVGLGLGVLFFIFAPQIYSIFSRDKSIIDVGIYYLRYIVFSYPFITISMTSGRALQGLGFGMPMLAITFLRVLLLSVVLAYLFVYWMNKPLEWVWIAMVMSVVLTSIVAILWLRSGLHRLDVAEIAEKRKFPIKIEALSHGELHQV